MTISSLISSLLPGRTTSLGALTPQRQPAKAAPEPISSPDNPSRKYAQTPALQLYTRKDARGQQSPSEPSPSAPISQAEPSVQTNAVTPKENKPDKPQPTSDSIRKPTGEALSKAEMTLLRELQKADRSVRAHEMAHLAAAGGYAKGGASFSYQRGPDGQNYAIGGEVQVDTSKENSPAANISKMQIIRQAALAPADPSPQDQAVAAQATLQIAESSKELQLAQAALSEQATHPRTAKESSENVRYGASQMPSPSFPLEIPTSSTTKPKRSYAAYLNPIPLANNVNRQNVDQIA